MSKLREKYFQSLRNLELSEAASPNQIKQAYRRLSKKYHPDVYPHDQGEKFKSISDAYSFLRKHPEPPAEVIYRAAPVHQSDDRREENRRRDRAKKQREAEMKQQMFQWIFSRTRVILFAIIILNIVLAIDYVLPNQPVNSELQGRKVVSIRTTRMKETSVILQFEGGYKMRLSNKVTKNFEKGDQFKIFQTPITKQIIKIVPMEEPNIAYYQSYSVFAVFGFIIPLVLICSFLYFRVIKNNDYKLSLILLMIFCGAIQLFLLLMT